jgi:hypothetical protein
MVVAGICCVSSQAKAQSTVYADQFPGYYSFDATLGLQNAVNSGASKVIVRAGMPWVLSSQIDIFNRNNLEIVFEPGVQVVAKQGFFQPTGSNLFRIEDSSDIKLTGTGATMQMRKADYTNPSLYAPSEYRHALSIRGSNRVTVDGLSILDSGGDGILIDRSSTSGAQKYSQDVTVQNVFVNNNYRQGMSVVSVDGLTVNNSRFNNTSGTDPQSGIDFEPDDSSERLSRIQISNSTFDSNGGSGIKVFAANLSGSSNPVSIRVENFSINGGNTGISVADYGLGSGTGSIVFQGGTITGTQSAGILVRNKTGEPSDVHVDFNNTILQNVATSNNGSELNRPIVFDIGAGGVAQKRVGGVDFNGISVIDSVNRPFLYATQTAKSLGLKEIDGSFFVTNPFGATWSLGSNLTNVNIQLITANQWRYDSSGDWGNIGNWTLSIPNIADAVANFLPTITGPRTVFTDKPVAVGTLRFDSNSSYQLSGQGSLTIDVTSGTGSIEVTRGTHKINLPTFVKDNTVVSIASGATLKISNPLTLVNGSVLTQTGSGTLLIEAPVFNTGASAIVAAGGVTDIATELGGNAVLEVAGGKMVLQKAQSLSGLIVSDGSAQIAPDDHVVVSTKSLTIAGDGTVDIGRSKLIVDYDGFSPLDEIKAAIASNNLVSAFNGSKRTLGYGDAAALLANSPEEFGGISADESSILIVATLTGDVNLDTAVDEKDLAIFSAHYGLSSGAEWTEGDFNFDGQVNSSDFAMLVSHFGQDLASLEAASVPEPTGIALVALTGALATFRRRRVRYSH